MRNKEIDIKNRDCEKITVSLSVGIYLSSQAAARQVFSAQVSLTSVFGMGTGGPLPQSTPTIVPSLDDKRDYTIQSYACQHFFYKIFKFLFSFLFSAQNRQERQSLTVALTLEENQQNRASPSSWNIGSPSWEQSIAKV